MALCLELVIGAWWAHLSNGTVDKDCLRVELGGGGHGGGRVSPRVKGHPHGNMLYLKPIKNHIKLKIS